MVLDLLPAWPACPSELCELQWSDVEFETATLHLRRAKGGAVGTHPLLGDELRALRTLKRDASSPLIFVSERGAPFSVSGLQKMVERVGIEAKMPFKVHPHMLRHATGYVLANKGTDTRTLQGYLGHRSIQSYGALHRAGTGAVQEPVAVTLQYEPPAVGSDIIMRRVRPAYRFRCAAFRNRWVS